MPLLNTTRTQRTFVFNDVGCSSERTLAWLTLVTLDALGLPRQNETASLPPTSPHLDPRTQSPARAKGAPKAIPTERAVANGHFVEYNPPPVRE